MFVTLTDMLKICAISGVIGMFIGLWIGLTNPWSR